MEKPQPAEMSLEELLKSSVYWAFNEGFEYGLATDLDADEAWEDFAKHVNLKELFVSPGK